jgi:hypothetical protein
MTISTVSSEVHISMRIALLTSVEMVLLMMIMVLL